MCKKMTANGFQLYAVVVFVVLPFTSVLKLIKDILIKSIPKATIAYKLLLAAVKFHTYLSPKYIAIKNTVVIVATTAAIINKRWFEEARMTLYTRNVRLRTSIKPTSHLINISTSNLLLTLRVIKFSLTNVFKNTRVTGVSKINRISLSVSIDDFSIWIDYNKTHLLPLTFFSFMQ
jgi:hypothetical protein